MVKYFTQISILAKPPVSVEQSLFPLKVVDALSISGHLPKPNSTPVIRLIYRQSSMYPATCLHKSYLQPSFAHIGPFQAAMDPEVVIKSQLAGLPIKLEEIQPTIDTKPSICNSTSTEKPHKISDEVARSAPKGLSEVPEVSAGNRKKRNTGNFSQTTSIHW